MWSFSLSTNPEIVRSGKKRVCPPYLIVYHNLSDFFNESLWLTAPLCLIFYFIHVCMMSKKWSTCMHPVQISFQNTSIKFIKLSFLSFGICVEQLSIQKSFICKHLIWEFIVQKFQMDPYISQKYSILQENFCIWNFGTMNSRYNP